MKPPSNSNRKNINTRIFIFGVTIAVFGIILFLLKIWIIELITTSILILKPNNFIDSYWQKIPDIDTDIYLFNWTNPEDFHNFGIKPKFKQIGPFKFKQTIEKVDVVWNTNNTVTYSQNRHFYFVDGNLSQDFTTFNVISLFLSHLVRNENYVLKRLVSAYIATSTPEMYLTETLQKLFFDGVENFIFSFGKYFPFLYPELPRLDTFSILTLLDDYKGLEGTINMGNGVNGIFDVHNWNFYNSLPHLNGSCAKVHGSAGELNSRNPSKQSFGMFVPALCRYVTLDFVEEVLVNGIVGYKYTAGNGLLDNGTLIPGNECYCAGDCLPSGLINVSACHYGVPMFASLPHFYGADPIYVNSVEGLHPTKEKHESYVVIEPTTGILIKSKAKIQVNLRIQRIEDITTYENIREMFYPFSWMDQKSVLPDNLLFLLKIYLMFPSLLTGIASVLTILGLILICISYKTTLRSWFTNLLEQKQTSILLQEQAPLRYPNRIEKTNNT